MPVQQGVWGIDVGQSALKALRLEMIDGTLTATAFDFIEREWDLLLGFELDDVADLLLFDRRQLDKARQARLAGHAHGDLVALGRVAREELFQCFAGQFIRVGVRLREDLRMLDVVEGGGRDFAVDYLQANCFQCTLSDIDAPDAGLNCHIDGLRERKLLP